jgi:hypothetical protein
MAKTKTTTISKNKLMNQIESLCNNININVEKLSELVYTFIQEYPDDVPLLRKKLGSKFPEGFENNLIKLAHGIIIPELILDSSVCANTIRSYPLSIQKQYYLRKKRVEVYTGAENPIKLNVFQMTTMQLRMVFDRHDKTIRDLNQQAAWAEINMLRKQKQSKKKQQKDAVWKIIDGKLVVNQPTTFTAPMLLDALKKMTT